MKFFFVIITILHVFFLVSMFDVYFRSPIIDNLPSVDNPVKSPARRLVLFVADGLRASSFFDFFDEEVICPYVREVLDNGYPWGISHCRVPTESRPGHVALIAGMYEDPSAVFKGWKENPVIFDNVFNQSAVTYSWGSPDIVPLFSRGNPKQNVFFKAYTSEVEDFAAKKDDFHDLNLWVLNEFSGFLEKAKTDETILKSIKQDKVVFFLHFLGVDVAGHAKKPHSRAYKTNIKGTDKIVKAVVELVENFYNDNATSYIFTADHGMTDWGSHGAGSQSETETPIAAWGAGIKKSHCPPRVENNNFVLPTECRQDINQADVAVLMSALLGTSIPTNSMGTLPINYLNFSDKQLAELLRLNAKQLYQQYIARERQVKEAVISSFFVEFQSLTTEKLMLMNNFNEGTSATEDVEQLKLLISAIFEGMHYYETYFQNYLLFSISLAFFGLIAFILSELYEQDAKGIKKRKANSDRYWTNIADAVFAIGFVLLTVIFLVQSLPKQYLLYNIIPLVLWWRALRKPQMKLILFSMKSLSQIFYFILYLCGIEIMFLSFFKREILMVAMVALSLWPITNRKFDIIPKIYKWIWTVSCCILAVFPVLPTVGTSIKIYLVLMSGVLWFAFGLILLFNRQMTIPKFANYMTCIQMMLIVPTLWNIHRISASFSADEGLSTLNQMISIILLCSFILTIFGGTLFIVAKFLNLGFSLGIPFLLFSTAHESFLPLILTINLTVWIIIEYILSTKGAQMYKADITGQESPITSNDFRKAYFFIFYIFFSFFAIGNIDSVSSFDTNWVRCFITVFSPFTMTFLILLKTGIPFLLTSCAFRFIVMITYANTRKLFYIVLLYCEIMGVQFLFLVKNTGSWLDIGKSISHYVIMEVTVLFLIILYQIAYFISKPVIRNDLSLVVLPKWHTE